MAVKSFSQVPMPSAWQTSTPSCCRSKGAETPSHAYRISELETFGRGALASFAMLKSSHVHTELLSPVSQAPIIPPWFIAPSGFLILAWLVPNWSKLSASSQLQRLTWDLPVGHKSPLYVLPFSSSFSELACANHLQLLRKKRQTYVPTPPRGERNQTSPLLHPHPRPGLPSVFRSYHIIWLFRTQALEPHEFTNRYRVSKYAWACLRLWKTLLK